MDETRYGTDSERYLKSGIVQLSQLKQHPHPDPYFHLSRRCREDQKQLEKLFRHEVCKPWLKENRLKAEVSRSVWENATQRGSRWLDGTLFPCLEFEENAEIYITEGIAMLHIARSSSVRGLAETFDSLEHRWWVLDFYCDDGSHSRQAALHSQPRAVSGLLRAATQRTGAQQLPYMPSLTYDLNQAGRLIGEVEGLAEAFGILARIPSMWAIKSFNFMIDIRKSWCHEEVRNYVRHAASQWEDITLHEDSAVVQSLDPDSIARLESRAPLLSRPDRDYIGHAFKRVDMLPQLRDAALRESVMKAVCRQGPILTVATFAKDLRALETRVHQPLISVLGVMRGARENTLRKRIQSVFEREFDVLSESGERLAASTIRKEAFVARCYQHVFLHTLRTAPPKGSIHMTQLSRLARRVFNDLLVDDQNHDPCNLSEDEDDIATRTPASMLPSYLDSEDVEVSKRHGVTLFKSKAAAGCLYGDQVLEGQFPEPPVSQSFMAKHIVCIFLFGGTNDFRACPSSSSSSTVSLGPMEALLTSPPFRDRDSISFCTADDHASVSEQSSYRVNESELDIDNVCWRHPHVVLRHPHGQTSMASSKAASVLGPDTSPVNMTLSFPLRKRPPPNFPRDSTRPHASAKRPRSLNTSFHQTSPSVRLRSPDRTPQVRPRGSSIASPIRSMHGADQWYGTPKVGSPAAEQYSPRTLGHSSAYSPDRLSVFNVIDLGPTRSSDAVEAYADLLGHRNPFSSDGSATVLDHVSEYNQYAPQSHTEWSVSDQGGQRAGDSLPLENTMPRANEGTTAVRRPEAERSVEPRTVSYVLHHKPNVFYMAMADANATEQFVRRQKHLSALSIFSYEVGGTIKYATGDQLHHAMKKYGLSVVRVISNRLGNTDNTDL
ncbi:hypothetical protein PMIN01_13360 [Paraphaeosphaeria minitans]|uniref:Uncharacterized protein n=1 Tax=Paraphaeosphaeria minitans TaxID=565426 RepID=A0A9P6G481_9PLEO|nr:hypothetical protein PMIN01_13360 [Paraphaeosphaeria minitans]